MSGWGIFLVFLVLWNGPCKLPFYIMDQHHVPASPLLGFISGGKYRAALMRSDPIFFLVIHTVMGCVLLGLWAALFLAPVTILGNRSLQVSNDTYPDTNTYPHNPCQGMRCEGMRCDARCDARCDSGCIRPNLGTNGRLTNHRLGLGLGVVSRVAARLRWLVCEPAKKCATKNALLEPAPVHTTPPLFTHVCAVWLTHVRVVSQVFFFLLAFVFALHILPETTGLPNRLFAKPINEVAIFIVLVGVFVGLLGCALDNEGMIVAGFNTTGSMSVVAPVLEIMEIVANVGVYLKTGVARDVDKNRDVGFNQSGWYKFRTKYTKMKCPFAPVTSATQV